MLSRLFCIVLILIPALSRHVPRYQDLDEEDQHLFRAAYDTPAYNQNEYEEEDDLPLVKIDLVKDGLWAMKAKIKELKAFDKALAANLLSTKLRVKELLKEGLLPLKKHHHTEKPSYSYQAPSYQAPHYEQPQYPAPQAQYPVPQAQYPAPQQPQYEYAAPAPQYGHDPYYGH